MQSKCASSLARSCARAPPSTSSLTGPHQAASYSSKRFSSASFTSRRPSRRSASIQIDESTSTMTISSVAFLDLVVGGGIIKRTFPQHPPEIPRLPPVDEIPDGERDRRTV